MKLKKKMPTKGHYVAIWTFRGKVWSSTYKWLKGSLYIYQELTDAWSPYDADTDHLSSAVTDERFYTND